MKKHFRQLTPREERVMEMRKEGKSLKLIGLEFGLSRERIRQIELQACEKIVWNEIITKEIV